MGKVTFRAYRQYPPRTKTEVRARAAKLRRRLADLMFAERPDPDEVYVALRDAWYLCGDVARRQKEESRQKFTDAEIRAACRRAAKTATNVNDACNTTITELLKKRGPEETFSVLALKKRLPRIGRFVPDDEDD
jgi:hypothetical protein